MRDTYNSFQKRAEQEPPFSMRETMRQEPIYEEIGEKLIDTLTEFNYIKESDVRIAYLSSDKEKKTAHKKILGECHKVEDKYRWICPYDFMIILYEPNIEELNDDQLETLIRHELHHIGIDYKDTGLSYYIEPHDVEEFWAIINDKGIDWSD